MTRALKPGDLVANVWMSRTQLGMIDRIWSRAVEVHWLSGATSIAWNTAIIGPARTPDEVLARPDRRGPPDGWVKAARRRGR